MPAGALFASEKLLPQDADAFSYFGHSASVDGEVAVVGAPYDDEKATDSGAAYIFERRGAHWAQAAKVTAPHARAYDRFGFSVAVAGRAIVVGADRRSQGTLEDSGAAFVYQDDGEGWRLRATLRPRDLAAKDALGIAVAALGDSVVVGAPGHHAGLPGAGAAFVFRQVGGEWREEAKLESPVPTEYANFGHAVALGRETALIGAFTSSELEPMGGVAHVFRRGAKGWRHEARLGPPRPQPLARFGASVALRGDLALVGAPRSGEENKTRVGSAFLFAQGADGWGLAETLTSNQPRSDEEFGRTVALGEGCLAVGSQFGDAAGLNTGVVYLFDQRAGRWRLRGPVLAADAAAMAEFSTAIALESRWLLVGAPRLEDRGNAAGGAYVFAVQQGPSTEVAP
jgi:hypothetical protein